MIPQPAGETPLSEVQRLTGVVIDPKKAFADIAARPRWWPPQVLLILTAIVFIACFSSRVGWETFMRQQAAKNSRMQQIPAEQREQALQLQVKVASYTGYAGAAVGVLVYTLITAGALTLVFKLMLGANVNFRQLFAVTSYSFVLGVITHALSIVVMYLKPPEDFDLQNPLAFNLGAFLPQDTPRWLVTLGTSFDLMTFWTMVLVATGISAADRKLGWGRAFTWVAVLWLVWVGVKTAFAAVTA